MSRRACGSRRCASSRAIGRRTTTGASVEARLQALPQFITEIDGVDIHFIHVRSQHDGALPVIVTHGWPGSIIEQLKIIGPLTDPEAHGGSAEDAFDVVIPSLPGHGYSGKPTTTGWDPIRIARAWVVLMERLGYDRYVAQGGDWGNAVTEQMALLRPMGLLGIHTNMPATIPEDIATALQFGNPPPRDLSDEERYAWDQLDSFYKHGLGYAQEMANRPQTLYALEDSPVGLAAWMLDHDAAQPVADRARLRRRGRGADARRHPRQRDAVLADEDGASRRRVCTGRASSRSSPRRASTCRPASARSPTRSTRRRGAGRRAPIPS